MVGLDYWEGFMNEKTTLLILKCIGQIILALQQNKLISSNQANEIMDTLESVDILKGKKGR